MTNPTTLPPLPDWLDVEAGEIKDEHLRDAGRAIAGYWPDIWRNRQYVETYGTFGPVYFPVDSVTPHACIARWAGEDAERWLDVAHALVGLRPGPPLISPYRTDSAHAHLWCTATTTQLYRALVNVAWDDWRAEYNKRREAEGGTT